MLRPGFVPPNNMHFVHPSKPEVIPPDNRFAPNPYSQFSVFPSGPLPQQGLLGAVNDSISGVPIMHIGGDKVTSTSSRITTTSTPAHHTPSPAKVNKSSSSGPKASNAGSKITVTEVKVENAFLAFLRSELLRVDKRSAISNVIEKFGFDEMLAARKLLFTSTGTKTYRYVGLNDPSTTHQRSYHCAASIITKMEELSQGDSKYLVSYLCTSEDLFRLLKISNRSFESNDIEERLARVESDMRSMKVQSSTQSQWPVVGSGNASSRVDLVRQMNQNNMNLSRSPSKKRRLEDDVIAAGTSGSSNVQHRKNGVKPNNPG